MVALVCRNNKSTRYAAPLQSLKHQFQLYLGDAPREGDPVFGVDLGTTASMSAISAYWPQSGLLETLAAFPTQPPLPERELADGCSGLYQAMARAGELRLLGGRVVPVDDLLDLAIKEFGTPSTIVADRWRAGELDDAIKNLGFG